MSRRQKSHASPVSLFSFQDIITSITGIMILVVIIFILQLINISASNASPTEKNMVKQADKMLDSELARIAAIQKNIKLIEATGNIDKIDLKKVSEKIISMREELEKIKKQTATVREKNASVITDIAEYQAKQKKIKQQEAKIKKLIEEQVMKQKKADKDLKKMLKQKLFSVVSSDGKVPIFIICGGNQIKILADQGQNEKILTDSSNDMFVIIQKLLAFLRTRSSSREYLSIMVTPESAGYVRRMPTLIPQFDTSYIPIEHVNIMSKSR